MKEVVFVTGNPHKASYLSKLLHYPLSSHKIDLVEIQSTSVREVAEDKARHAYEILQKPVLVEDAGLYFEAWGELPGPFIKYYLAQDNGLENICRMLDGFDSRRAYSIVNVTYYAGAKFNHFEKQTHGEIARQPRGDGGFGYDAIWCIDGHDGRTRAELSPDEYYQTYYIAHSVDQLSDFLAKL